MFEYKNIKRNAIGLIIISFISQILGFLREIVVAYYFGLSNQIDAYQVAEVIPLLITQIFVTTFPLMLIPTLLKHTSIEGNRFSKGEDLISTVVIGVSSIISILTIVIMLVPGIFIYIIAPGLDLETRRLAILLTRILAPNTLFITIYALYGAILGAYKKFLAPAICGLLLNLCIILALFSSANSIGIFSMAYGFLTAGFLMFIFISIYFTRLNKGVIKVRFYDKALFKDFIKNVLPVIIGSSMISINLIIDRNMASLLGTGAIAALAYSYKIINMCNIILVSPINKVIFTDLSMDATEGRINQVIVRFRKSMKLIIALIIPLSMFIIVLKVPIITFIFKRGNFDSIAVLTTANCMSMYGIGLLAISINLVMSMIFYSSHLVKVPLLMGSLTIVLNILLNYVFSRFIGVSGIALGTSISAIMVLPLWYYEVKKHFSVAIFKEDSIFIIKNILISFVSGLVLTAILNINTIKSLNAFFILAISGIVGLGLILIFGYKLYSTEFGSINIKET